MNNILDKLKTLPGLISTSIIELSNNYSHMSYSKDETYDSVLDATYNTLILKGILSKNNTIKYIEITLVNRSQLMVLSDDKKFYLNVILDSQTFNNPLIKPILKDFKNIEIKSVPMTEKIKEDLKLKEKSTNFIKKFFFSDFK